MFVIVNSREITEVTGSQKSGSDGKDFALKIAIVLYVIVLKKSKVFGCQKAVIVIESFYCFDKAWRFSGVWVDIS